MRVSRRGRPLPGILVGHHEPIFDALPGNVLSNLRSRTSENALLWNRVYPAARDGLNLARLMSLRPLWGTAGIEGEHDSLVPYFWGYRTDGVILPGLGEALATVDGGGPGTEVDLYLVGEHNLIVIEAKRGSGFGRCSRYNNHSCPAVHVEKLGLGDCRYWAEPGARFISELDFPEPTAETTPICHRHYQLARTLMVGRDLSQRLGLRLHLWLLVPQRKWRHLEPSWLDFTNRLIDSDLWRRLRVLSWEAFERHSA